MEEQTLGNVLKYMISSKSGILLMGNGHTCFWWRGASSDTLKPWNDSVNQPLWAFALDKNKKELFSLCCTRINRTLLYCTRINTIQPHHRLWQRLGSYGFRLSITASTIIVIVPEIGHEWNQLHPHIIVYCYHIKVKKEQGPVIEAIVTRAWAKNEACCKCNQKMLVLIWEE